MIELAYRMRPIDERAHGSETSSARPDLHLPSGSRSTAVSRPALDSEQLWILAWAVRRLSTIQSKYIRLFYGGEVLATLEAL